MNQTVKIEPPKTLFAAMAKAFPEIEGASKDKLNPHFKTKYADLGSVMDAIKPALANYGLWFRQSSVLADGGVCIETFICHESGEEVSCGSLFVPASKNDAQGYGSALTYCRRYALQTAFGVPSEDDDGNAAVKSAPANRFNDAPSERNGDEPAPREKLDGKHASKSALQAALRAYGHLLSQCVSGEALMALQEAYSEDIAQGLKYLPKWMHGDPENPDKGRGLVNVAIDRKALCDLLDDMRTCETQAGMDAWAKANGDSVDGLSDTDRRIFEKEWELHGAARMMVEQSVA